MKSPKHYRRISESRRAVMAALVVIMLSNLLPLGGNVAAGGKRESVVMSPHIGTSPSVTGERGREPVTPDSPGGFAAPSIPDQPTRERVSVAHSKLPIAFEANLGQTDSQVKFFSHGAGYTVFLTSTEAVVLLSRGRLSNSQVRSSMRRPINNERDRTQAAIRMRLVGGAPEPQVVGLEELGGKSNYFEGSDPVKWRTNVPLYSRVQYKEVYPGIDLVYYGNQRDLEYDFVVAAGADPAQIRLSFDGAQKIWTDANGDLVLKTVVGEVRLRKLLVYEEAEGVKKEIEGRYVLKGSHEVGFAPAGYDRNKPLIIDPVISYATYLGGSEHDVAQAIAVDSNGYAYVTGYTYSTTFPSKNAFQPNLSRYFPPSPDSEPWKGLDAFVTKFDPSKAGADSLVYSTFLGGASNDFGYGIAVDSNGNAYVTGVTRSVDTTRTPEHEAEFPVVNAFQQHLNSGGLDYPQSCYSNDAFVTKLNAGGNALLYSTYFGGNGSDEGRAIAVDSFGNAYVAGKTDGECAHLPGYEFPLRHALQPSYADDQNGFVAKFDTSLSGDASLIFSTMLGGGPNSGDFCNGIAVTPSGSNIYVTGDTISTNFPIKNAYQPQKGYGSNAFVTVLNGTLPLSLLYSTFLGSLSGTSQSHGAAIAVDSSGNAYVTGYGGVAFPTRNPLPGSVSVGPFVTKINPFLAGDASLIYSTFLSVLFTGQQGAGIAVDADGYAYVTGYVDTPGGILTKDSIQSYGGGNYDAFIAKLIPAGNDLVYSTYLGGGAVDQAFGIAIDASGNAYVAGLTQSIDFPTTTGAFRGTKPPSSPGYTMDAFVAKVSDKRANLVITTTASPNPVVTATNFTYTISVTNLGPDPANGVIVTDNLAPEVDFVSSTPATTGSDHSRTIRFDSIAAGASVSVTIDTVVSCFASDGRVMTNTATVTSLTPDPDTSNNSATLETIASNPPPEITCPADIVSTSPVVNYPMPTVVDNCLGLVMARCSPASGSTFPIGTTVVTCVVSDAGGNGSRCGFTVTVKGTAR